MAFPIVKSMNSTVKNLSLSKQRVRGELSLLSRIYTELKFANHMVLTG